MFSSTVCRRFSFLFIVLNAFLVLAAERAAAASTFGTAAPVAVATFESVGVYWAPAAGASNDTAKVEFRVLGASTWRRGLDLWFDARNSEYRGSLVELTAGTTYEIRLTLVGSGFSETLQASTWRETFPIASTLTLPATSSAELVITQSGTPSGYVLYTAAPGATAVIDQAGKPANSTNCVTVQAAYVIIRGLILKNCQRVGIDLRAGSHDVVIEDNDISGWGGGDNVPIEGPTSTIVTGWDEQGAIYCDNSRTSPKVFRVVVQRNRLHHPRFGSPFWGGADGNHPRGAQGVFFSHCGTNHVFRYNEIYSWEGHYFNDGIGGADNFTLEGFPFADSDIYGNKISETYDDGIEAEGANRNVRIWGNYLTHVMAVIANAVTSIGPLYVWRNVSNSLANINDPRVNPDNERERGPFIKAGGDAITNGGRAYYFHNTALQPAPPPGSTLPLGPAAGIEKSGGTLYNFVSRNNIWHIHKPTNDSIRADGQAGPIDANFDLYNGLIENAGANAESSGFHAVPIYANPAPADSGNYALASQSPGFGAAAPLANFNDQFARPDVGAHQSGTLAMQFGVNANRATATGPTARVDASPLSGAPPLLVSFSAAGSSAGTSAIVTYHFVFGDGATQDGVQVSHTYAAAGTYTATLTVTDGNGLQSTAQATVTVTSAPPPPPTSPLAVTVTLTPGSTVARAEKTDIAAVAGDGRPLSSVDFLIDGVLKLSDTAAPFQFTWQTLDTDALGDHTLLVRARDAGGNVATASQTITLLSRTCNVSVSATTIAQGQPLNVQGACSAWENVGKIEFFVDGVLQSTDTSSPYAWTMNTGAFPVGSHTIAIRGYLPGPERVSNHSVVVEIVAPSVALTLSPGATVARPERVDITAAASDGRALRSVDFLIDGVLVSSVTAAPFTYRWPGTAALGFHTLVVRATDTSGGVLTTTRDLYLLSRTCNVFLSTANAFATDSTVFVSTNTLMQGQPLTVQGLCSAWETVGKIDFFVDGVLQTTAASPPYTASMSALPVGIHTIAIRGYLPGDTRVSNHSITVEIVAP